MACCVAGGGGGGGAWFGRGHAQLPDGHVPARAVRGPPRQGALLLLLCECSLRRKLHGSQSPCVVPGDVFCPRPCQPPPMVHWQDRSRSSALEQLELALRFGAKYIGRSPGEVTLRSASPCLAVPSIPLG
jgi:hypothetical protein